MSDSLENLVASSSTSAEVMGSALAHNGRGEIVTLRSSLRWS